MKNKFIALVSAIVVFLGITALPANAGSGLSVGAIVNLSTFDTTGTETETDANLYSDRETNSASHSEDVNFGSLFVEYSAMGDSYLGMTLGLEYIPGEASLDSKARTDTVSDSEETSTDTGTYTAKAEISNHMAVYLEPTIGTDNFGLYVKGGFSRVTVQSLESISVGTDDSAYGDEGVFGLMYGMGVRAKHSSGAFLKLEGLQIDYDSVSLQSTTGNQNIIQATPEQSSVRLAIGFQF